MKEIIDNFDTSVQGEEIFELYPNEQDSIKQGAENYAKKPGKMTKNSSKNLVSLPSPNSFQIISWSSQFSQSLGSCVTFKAKII